MEFHVEDHPDPLDIELLETQIRREASAAMALGDEVDLAIFVRDARGRSSRASADGPGATAASCKASGSRRASADAASRHGSSPPPKPRQQGVGAHRPSTSPTTFRPEPSMSTTVTNWWARVEDFPTGADALWYRKRLQGRAG